MRILVVGSSGLLGRAIINTMMREHEVFGSRRKDFDLSNPEEIEYFFSRDENKHYDVIIHTSAFVNVDECERKPDYAYLVNAMGTRVLSLKARDIGAPIVYISTDYVFDGEKGKPYTEWDVPNPINVYGKSKFAGEREVASFRHRYAIVRVSWLFGPVRETFVDRVVRSALEGKPISVASDVVSVPSYTKDVAEAIKFIVENSLWGIFHAVPEGFASRYEIACFVLDYLGLPKKYCRKVSAKKIFYAPRPRFSAMKNVALASYGFKIRHWQEGLAEYLEEKWKGNLH